MILAFLDEDGPVPPASEMAVLATWWWRDPAWWRSDAPPTWLAVLIGIVGGIVAYMTYRREHEAAQRERDAAQRERDAFQADREREKRDQASRVAVWPYKADLDRATFGLVNSSVAPVYSVEVYATSWRKGAARQKVGRFDVGVTPPYGSPRYFETELEPADYDTHGYLYGISFRDSEHVDWHRIEGGPLVEGRYPEADQFPKLRWPAPPGHGSPHEIRSDTKGWLGPLVHTAFRFRRRRD